jgi:GH25 family lysozyme M1 (1,4-beta-N-acetylmuramidase)
MSPIGKKAKDAGLLWGAYHFGTGSDGLKQAQHFLDVVGNDPGTLLVLDFEPNPTGPSMDSQSSRHSYEASVMERESDQEIAQIPARLAALEADQALLRERFGGLL